MTSLRRTIRRTLRNKQGLLAQNVCENNAILYAMKKREEILVRARTDDRAHEEYKTLKDFETLMGGLNR